MNRTDPNYTLKVVAEWVRTTSNKLTCPYCHGLKNHGFRFQVLDDVFECPRCYGKGFILEKLPPPPSLSKAFLDHMHTAFQEYWTKQEEIEAACRLKQDQEKSLTSSEL